MIPIYKKEEPAELAVIREKAERKNLDSVESYNMLQRNKKAYNAVKNSLLEEQKGLCAYCMCKIPRNDVDNGIACISIEHIIPRNRLSGQEDIGQGLDYENLLLVCNGNKGGKGTRTKDDLTCDAHKGNKEFKRVNPCKPETLETIYYTLDGKIGASDPDVQCDLTQILNLNCPKAPLVRERKSALDELVNILSLDEDAEDYPQICREYAENIKNSEDGFEYAGILLWYLNQFS